MSIFDPVRKLWLARSTLGLAAALQLGCAVAFATDVIAERTTITTHTWVEAVAVVALVVGALLALRDIRRLVRRNVRAERGLDAACGEFQKVIDAHFEAWGLSKAECDVALLSIKGMTNTEITRMLGTREGTIKAQSAAIYRKAGVNSRADLISALIEDLIGGLVIAQRAAA